MNTEAQKAVKDEIAKNTKALRAELLKRMPGYEWTVHKSEFAEYLQATGVQSAGFNRLSTLHVEWRPGTTFPYQVRSSGYGLRAPWLHTYSDVTLARALRGLQRYYENEAQKYRIAVDDLQFGRKPTS